jgi:RHS repeat-associated protein
MSVEYLLSDHLGSTSINTDASGAKVSEMRYTPWGEVRSHWIASASISLADYTFTGQYSYMDDPSTSGVTEGFGLMFYNARWYDPYLNQFTQPDTIVPDAYNPQDWNRYAYARNNPLKYTDPSGHIVVPLALTLIGVAVVGVAVVWTIAYTFDPNVRVASQQLGSALGDVMSDSSEKISDSISALFVKGEYIPSGLSKEERIAYRDAIHRYKHAWGIPREVDVPKDVIDAIGEALKNGESPLDAVDGLDGPPEALTFSFPKVHQNPHADTNQNHSQSKPLSRIE